MGVLPDVISAIFGLGNPGQAYRGNRHNAGFLFLEFLEARNKVTVLSRSRRFSSRITRVEMFSANVALVRPWTYMNLSGIAYRAATAGWGLGPKQTLVIYDDLDLPFGSVRIRARGSGGSHKGMKNIIAQAGSADMPRIRIGIAPPDGYDDAAEFVLSNFTHAEQEALPAVFNRVYDALATIYREGLVKAMSQFNTPPN